MRRAALVAGILLSTIGCREYIPADPSRLVLRDGWDAFKRSYIDTDGNVFDPQRGGGQTTSEGQGYAMLRAAWMRDEHTFVRTFNWTEQHLRRADGLYSWLWSPTTRSVADANTASDADQEIAFALVMGSQIFNDTRYRDRAREILRAIREHERVEVSGGWFPAAGNWATSRRIVNLSYFVPYAYPYFARVDPEGRWNSVTRSGYELIDKTLRQPSVRLIPDFMAVSATGDPRSLPDDSGLSADFTSDAMRIYWRVAVDCMLHHQSKACSDPLGAGALTSMLSRDGALFTRYSVDGSPLERVESSSFYGAALPFFALHAPAARRALEFKQLSAGRVSQLLNAPNRYFDNNWVWFGLAAVNGTIVSQTPQVDAIPQVHGSATERPRLSILMSHY